MGYGKKGLVHLYTGDGKGKTTAAFGLALRAAGAGLKVCVFQFLKGGGRESSEVRLCRQSMPNIDVIRFKQVHPFFTGRQRSKGLGREAKCQPTEKDLEALKESVGEGLAQAGSAILSGRYDLVILDEIVNALRQGLVKIDKALDLIKNKPSSVELVLTGRGAPKKLVEVCDYVTEMKLIKHPYQQGTKCRKGIEF